MILASVGGDTWRWAVYLVGTPLPVVFWYILMKRFGEF